MILSVSRRTDIPAYYSPWFFNRIREGYLYVRNPFNAHQVSRMDLSPQVVDCMVFWTKNPAPMLERLGELEAYPYYFHFTLTGYGRDVEPGLPDKRKVLIPLFQELSRRIGKERVIWRYDPILVNEVYTADYHLRAFARIAESLGDYTERVVISFLDLYAKTRRNMKGMALQELTREQMRQMAAGLADIAFRNRLRIETCAEAVDLGDAGPVGIAHGSCIDQALVERLVGCPLDVGKDRNQRPECGCVESVDVGTYNTCPGGCRYCYASYSRERVRETAALYDAASPLLCGVLGPQDRVTERKVRSLKGGCGVK